MIHRFHGRPLAFLALGALVAACRESQAPLAPGRPELQFNGAPGDGLHGAIAFHSNRDGDFDIYIMNADGSDVTSVTHNDIHEFDPVLSPNGQQIVFGRLSPAGADVVVINADGSGERVVVENGFPGAWSPDGNQIAFGRNGEVYVMNVDGSGVTQLTNSGAGDFPTAWSPNGKQIAFQGLRSGNLDIYAMNTDGTGVIQLTNDPATDFGDRAGWSPDGRRFLFSSTRDGGDIDIFVMNADGSGVTALTQNDGIADDDPVWSPDGKHIAFHSTADGDEEIVVINADGTGGTQLTHNATLPDGTPVFDAVPAWRAQPLTDRGDRCLLPPAGLRGWWPGDGDVGDLIAGNHGIGTFNVYVMTQGGSRQTQLTDVPFYNARPDWSHDGKRITFTACRATDASCEIYVMNADGSAPTKLTADFSVDHMSVWSPDDSKIAFSSERDGNFEIYVMNADGSNQVRLTTHGALDWQPSWSPDGRKIAFESDRDGNHEIYVMNADGSSPVNLTHHPGSDERPRWSPRGDMIAFDTDRDGDHEIYVMRSDGSEPTRVTHDPGFDYGPAWSPNADRIAFTANRDANVEIGNFDIYVMKPDGSVRTRVTDNPAWDADPAWTTGKGGAQPLAFASAQAHFAPAKVREGFSFGGGAGEVVFAPGAGIDDLQQLTIDAWVKHNSLPSGRIQRYVTLNNEKAVLRYDGENGPAQLHFYMRIDGQLYHIRANNVLQVGVFHHVAGSYDGAVMRLYLDGGEVGNLAITGAVGAGGGVIFSSDNEGLDGLLDEIEIFDRALSSSEVRAIFQAGDAGKCKNAPGT